MKVRFVLMPILALLVFGGCRENYKAEKLFWQATKKYEQAGVAEMQNASIADLKPVTDAFLKVVEAYPATPKGVESLTAITKIYASHKHYAAARESLATIMELSEKEPVLTRAIFQTAQLYEAEGNWEAAEEKLWVLCEDWQLNPLGLKAGIKILSHYQQQPDGKDALKAAGERVLGVWEKLLEDLGPIKKSADVSRFIAKAHLMLGEWQEARDILYKAATEFPDYERSEVYLINAAELSAANNELGRAADIYKAFLSSYPKSAEYVNVVLRLAATYRAKGLYPEALGRYEEVLPLVVENRDSEVKVKLEIAKTYQLAEEWERSEELLNEVQRDYSDVRAAQGVPLLLATQYYRSGEKAQADEYLSRAIQNYRKQEDGANESEDARFYQKMQNLAMMQKGDWQGFLANIDRYIAREQDESLRGQWVFIKALITEQRLEMPEKARLIYSDFLQEYPNHPLAAVAETRQKLLLSPVAA